MSALGHKQTFAVQIGMSALHPKADMCGATKDVRYVPIADIRTILVCGLFDDLVGTGKQRRRHRDAERLGSLEIDHHLEFGRRLYR